MLRQDTKLVCEEYLDYIRSCTCIGCNKKPCEPHHLIPVGWRQSKRNDFSAVPVERDCHNYFEDHGIDAFATEFQVDPWKCALLLAVEFWMLNNGGHVKITRGKI